MVKRWGWKCACEKFHKRIRFAPERTQRERENAEFIGAGCAELTRKHGGILPDRDEQQAQSTKYLGVGLTVVGSTALFLGVGWWVDGRVGSKPVFTLIGALVGLVAGFYQLFRRLSEDQPRGVRKPDSKG